MSDTAETVSWQFIGRRLDSVQADTADMRRRMIALEGRFDSFEASTSERFTMLDNRMAGIERRQGVLEERMNAFVERQSRLEATGARTLFLLQRLALKVGGIEDETGAPPA